MSCLPASAGRSRSFSPTPWKHAYRDGTVRARGVAGHGEGAAANPRGLCRAPAAPPLPDASGAPDQGVSPRGCLPRGGAVLPRGDRVVAAIRSAAEFLSGFSSPRTSIARCLRPWWRCERVLRDAAFVAARSETATRLAREWGAAGAGRRRTARRSSWEPAPAAGDVPFSVGYAGRLVESKGLPTCWPRCGCCPPRSSWS